MLRRNEDVNNAINTVFLAVSLAVLGNISRTCIAGRLGVSLSNVGSVVRCGVAANSADTLSTVDSCEIWTPLSVLSASYSVLVLTASLTFLSESFNFVLSCSSLCTFSSVLIVESQRHPDVANGLRQQIPPRQRKHAAVVLASAALSGRVRWQQSQLRYLGKSENPIDDELPVHVVTNVL